MTEYVFDVKMYAYIQVNAPDRKSAEATLAAAVDSAELRISILGADGTATQTTVPVYVDDVEFPFLVEVDGVPIDDIEDDEGDEELAS